MGVFDAGYFWYRIKAIEEVECDEVVGIQMEKDAASVVLDDDSETHGTFCTWGMAGANTNYIGIMPIPVGAQTLGGDGKALMLTDELEMQARFLCAGMHVPYELVFGGLSYSGSNMSLRMVENAFIGYRIDHENMLNDFVIKRIARFMRWKPVYATMKKFKMADDLQRMSFQFQLNQGMKISDETLLQECDHDPATERERKERELAGTAAYQRKQQLAQAETTGETTLIQAKYQKKAAEMLGPPPGADPGAAQADQWGGGEQPGAAAGQPPQSGEQGEMVPGDQTGVPGMSPETSVSMENAKQPTQDGVPTDMQSPISAQTQGGGMNLLYLASREAARLVKLDPQAQETEKAKIQGANPQLYSLIFQLLQRRKGSQQDPLDPAASPLPQQKPERRAAHVGV
jgi:hypothetical protein